MMVALTRAEWWGCKEVDKIQAVLEVELIRLGCWIRCRAVGDG